MDRLGYLTTYTYDALDNLKTVNQGGLTRGFSYSSLKRLTSAQNPESGTITYGYDAAGNLLNRTELRVSLAISGYDALNRPLSKNYTPNTTPAVSYSYDTCANGKGRICGMASTAASTAYTYDELGRTTQATQTTGIAYPTKYAYNLADGVTSVEFPGSTVTLPRKVSYQYDPAGRVIAV